MSLIGNACRGVGHVVVVLRFYALGSGVEFCGCAVGL
jgi:hypothetical protein